MRISDWSSDVCSSDLSVSIWLFEENGEFAFPRGGIEAESQSWDDRLLQANFSFADGRVLSGAGRGRAPSPIDNEGKPSIVGAGSLQFRCVEPRTGGRAGGKEGGGTG